jgi:tRNA pseudouridine55 synthase
MGKRYNKRKRGRAINGILLFDKPPGMSSNEALQKVKRLYHAAKAGHTGSLDPLATGMLPICFGEATKMSAFLLDADKAYTLRCQLGVTTTTGDREGEVLEHRPVPAVSPEQLNEILRAFTGEIDQIPPMYSALKHEGERLYNLARKGIEVERKPRKVTIHSLSCVAQEAGYLELEVHCSKGTYVRTLVEDIGQKLGCGAHVTELRRTRVSPYEDPDDMVSLSQLEELAERGYEALDALLLPLETAVASWPDVHLTADSAFYIGQGQAVLVPHAPSSGLVRLYEPNERFIGMGQVQDDGKVAPRRLFNLN